VLDPEGLGVPGIEVTLDGAALSAPLRTVSTAPDGAFSFDGVPAPAAYVVTTPALGVYLASQTSVALRNDDALTVTLPLRLGFSEDVTVTDTREGRLKRETPATVDVVTRDVIEEVKPTHPGQLMSRVPGVWVNTTGGEGHMTAIRQPLTTNPVYLYLEDGVPTRSTGFFNHNALYEVNVPAAEGIEVSKGPGSALYGSDAIGGVVNVISRSALGPSSASLDVEAGGFDWRRLMAGGNVSSGLNGLRADLNLTHSDGWRDATAYDRQGGTVRWDRVRPGGSSFKTLLGFSHIDQQTAGSSALQEDDYLSNPTRNLTPISYRRVSALRLSSDFERVTGSTLWSAIPFFRYNTMGLLANWSLTYDPSEYDTRNSSYGVLMKVRHDLTPMRTQLVAGFDVDLSPGSRLENQIFVTGTPTSNGKTIFSAYTPGAVIYDYDVTFLAASPYAQIDFSPTNRVRASLGARFDRMQYDYDDRLETVAQPRYQRPGDTSRSYTHLSPKAGVTVQISDAVNVFGAYRNAFRVPSEGQLFRQGSTLDTVDLKPVDAHNLEGGVRASFNRRFGFEVSIYRLDKRDDILSYREPLDGLTHVVNAGRTLHKGIEVGGQASAGPWLQVSANYAYARHTYEEWVLDPRQAVGVDYSANDMETAPRHMGNVVLTVMPERRGGASLEAVHLGSYWMDAANTQQYGGHTLLNLRGQFRITEHVQVFGRVLNLMDRLYAESSSYTLQRGRELAPGMPRTAYVGVSLGWRP
jgi:outer membrane receptor protein involved in Fe transport